MVKHSDSSFHVSNVEYSFFPVSEREKKERKSKSKQTKERKKHKKKTVKNFMRGNKIVYFLFYLHMLNASNH